MNKLKELKFNRINLLEKTKTLPPQYVYDANVKGKFLGDDIAGIRICKYKGEDPDILNAWKIMIRKNNTYKYEVKMVINCPLKEVKEIALSNVR